MQEVEHLDFKEAKAKLYRITNTPLEDYTLTLKKEEPKRNEDAKELEAIHSFVMTEYNKMQNKDELIQYLNNRNISILFRVLDIIPRKMKQITPR